MGRQEEKNIKDNFGISNWVSGNVITELRNSVGRASFSWVVMGIEFKKGDEFYFGHVKFVTPLKHSNDDVKQAVYMHQELERSR